MSGKFETPYLRRKFKHTGKYITFDVTLSGRVLGTKKPLNALPSIMNHFRQNHVKTVLDFGAGRLRNTWPLLLDGNFNVYVCEFFEQLISDNDSEANFKITKESLKNLRLEGIPNEILKKIENTKDLEIRGKRKLLAVLRKTIGDKQTVKYKSLILKHVDSELHRARQVGLKTLIYPKELEEAQVEFDAILMSYVLNILPDEKSRKDVLEACRDKARQGAFLVIASPNYNTNVRRSCSDRDEHDIGWIRYASDNYKYKAFYSEPSKNELIKLISKTGFEYEDDWHQSTAKVLRFHKV